MLARGKSPQSSLSSRRGRFRGFQTGPCVGVIPMVRWPDRGGFHGKTRKPRRHADVKRRSAGCPRSWTSRGGGGCGDERHARGATMIVPPGPFKGGRSDLHPSGGSSVLGGRYQRHPTRAGGGRVRIVHVPFSSDTLRAGEGVSRADTLPGELVSLASTPALTVGVRFSPSRVRILAVVSMIETVAQSWSL